MLIACTKKLKLIKIRSNNLQFLDVVALTEDLPELQLYRGQVGAI